MEKNLTNEEAIRKFKELVEDIRICMFITNSTEERDHTRPMATIDVEEDGTLWFFTDIRSIKVAEVESDRWVHLIYAHPGKESYMDVWGRGRTVTDRSVIDEKWSPMVKAFFPEGKDDPNLALLKVSPLDVYYWDTEGGKMMSMFKIVASVVAGKTVSQGQEGRLRM